jgi:VCBS repeat-containing protein
MLDAAAVATVADAIGSDGAGAPQGDGASAVASAGVGGPGAETSAAFAAAAAAFERADDGIADGAPAGSRVLSVIDARVDDPDALASLLGASSDVLMLDGAESGIAAVAQHLAVQGGYDAVHIFSHGQAGSFALGSDAVSSDALQNGDAAAGLAAWAEGLSADADILIYGCDVASTDAGLALIEALSSMTGADVAASDDLTGSAALGGDWDLEVAHGSIEAGSAMEPAALAAWQGLLAAPTVADGEAEVREVNEDATMTVTNLSVTGTGTLTVTLTLTEDGGAPASGSFSLSQTTGLAFTTGDGTGDSSMVFTGTAADVNAALNNLTYSPTPNFNGDAQLAVNVTNADGAANRNVALAVVPVNDAPDLSPPALGDPATAEVNEGDGNTVTLTPAHFGIDSTSNATLGAFDPDLDTALSTVVPQTADQQTFQVTALPSEGRLLLNGNPLTAGSLFTLQNLIDGNLAYEHQGAQANEALTAGSESDSFNVTIRDGATGNDTGTINIEIIPVNQAPTVSAEATVTAYEGRFGVPIQVTVSDPDQVSTTWTIEFGNLTLQGGTLYLENAGGGGFHAGDTEITNGYIFTGTLADLNSRLRFDVSADEPGAAVTFDISVTDDDGGTNDAGTTAGDGLTTTQTITIELRENNDHPILVTNSGTNPAAPVTGATNAHQIVLTNAMLNVTDADSPNATLTYTVTEAVTNLAGGGTAQIRLGGAAIGLGASFTQADINAGAVSLVYTTDGGGAGGNQDFRFGFEVRDGEITAFSTVRQVEDRIEGGTRNDADTAFLDHTNSAGQTNGNQLHQFHFRFDNPTGAGAGVGVVTNVAPTVGTIVGISATDLIEEGTPVTIGTNGDGNEGDTTRPRIEITDPDNSPNEITIRLEKMPTGGSILLNGVALSRFDSFTQQDLIDGNVTYRHDGGEQFLSGNLGFAFSVSDGAALVTPTVDGDDNNFTVEAAPVNDTPSASVDRSGVVAEGGTLTFNTSGQPNITLSDVDGSGDAAPTGPGTYDTHESEAGTDELFVTITALPSHGELRYNGNPLALNATLLKSEVESTLFTYVHDGTENFDDSFDLQVNDAQGFNGAAPDNDSIGNTITVNIDISPLNDDPLVDPSTPDDPTVTNTINTGLRVEEGASGVIGGAVGGVGGIPFSTNEDGATHATLVAIDPDNSATQIQYRITSTVTEGQLRLNGQAIGVNSTFTQDDLNNGRLTYRHLGGEGAGVGLVTDSFDFEVGDAGGGTYPTGTFDIEVWPGANDAPTVTTPNTPVDIDDTDAASNPITGISVGDPDLPNGTDFLQVTVRLTQANGTPLTAGQYAPYTLTSSAVGSGVTIDGDHDGNGDFLELRGTVAQINTYLAGLQMGSSTDPDVSLRLEVIADDRIRDGAGVLDTTGQDANGGERNQNPTEGGATLAVPGDDFSAYTETVSSEAADGVNLASGTVELRVSTEDDPATISDPGAQTVNEDIATTITPDITIADPESTAFGIDTTVTLSVPNGTLGVGTQAGVTITGNNTGSVTLVGAANDINTLLDGGVTYTSGSNDNIDNNGGTTGDTTLTVEITEGAAAIGNEAGGTPGDNTVTRTIPITVTPVNDAPTVSQAGGVIYATDPNTAIAVTGFGVGDVDISGDPGNLTGDEQDFVQATIRLLDETNTPLNLASYNGATLAITAGAVTTDGTLDGTDAALQIRGTLAEVNTALGSLQLTLGPTLGNADHPYQVQVVVDDRIRNLGTGVLDASGIDANGGEQNNSDGSTSAEAVPATAFDPYADAVPAIFNMDSATREVRPSSNNEAPVVGKTAPNDVDEDVRTRVGGDITVEDTESENFDLDVQVTISVPTGILSVAGTGDQSGTTVSGVDIAGDETGSITLTGHADVIETFLNDATNGLFYTSPTDDNSDQNAGDAGDVTATIGIDELDAATSFSVARQTASATFSITVNPINDAPVIGGPTEDGTNGYGLYQDLDGSGNPTGNWHRTTAADNPADGTDAPSAAPISLLTGAATVSDVDLDAALNDTGANSFGGGSITVSMTGGYFAGDVLAANAGLPGVASVAGGTGSNLVINLSDGATIAQVRAILESVTFDNDGDPSNNGANFSRDFSIVLNDGNNNNDAGATDGVNDAGGDGAGNPNTLDSNTLTGTLRFHRFEPPVATDNTNAADAGTPTVTGDLRTDDDGGGTDNDPDADNADLRVTVTDTGGTITGGTTVPGGGVTLTGTYGSVTIQQDGSYTYNLDVNDPDFIGLEQGETVTDVFAYRITDQEDQSDDATLTITITGQNDPPTATNNTNSMGNEDPSVSGNVRDDGTPDSDPEDPTGDLTVSAVAGVGGNVGNPVGGTYGDVTINADGSYTYTLNTGDPTVSGLGVGETLTETFSYTIQDTDGGTDTANLTITINGPESVPDPLPAPAPTPPAPPVAGPPAPPAAPPVPVGFGGGEPPVFETASLQDRRSAAVPFHALGSLDGYRTPLITPVELTVTLQDRVLAEGLQSFAIPSTAFRHTDPAEQLSVEATLSDGSPLPGYMTFDSDSGVFSVETDIPRNAGVEGVTVRVIGRDSAGNEAGTTFYVSFVETDQSSAFEEVEAVNQDGEATPQPEEAQPDGTGAEADEAGGEDDQAALDVRPPTQQQLEAVGRQAALTARDQLLADLLTVFGKVA